MRTGNDPDRHLAILLGVALGDDLTERTSPRETAFLLPLIAGLFSVALARAIPSDLVSTLAYVVTLLGLGAVLPAKPWRSAAIGSLPGACLLLARSPGKPIAIALLTIVLFAVSVGINGLLVKGGALLAQRSRRDHAAHRDDTPPGPWKPFQTKAQRGRFLVVLLAIVLIGGQRLSVWGSDEVDREADRRAAQIRTALNGRSPKSLQIDILGSANAGTTPPGGPYLSASPGNESFDATVELNRRLQYRCVQVHVSADGQVSTDIKKRQCRN